MIQRIQSLFFLFCALAFGGLFYFPFASTEVSGASFFSDQLFDISDHIILLILGGLGALLALITIFLYKNRKLQLKFGYVLIIISILTPILAYLLFSNQADNIQDIKVEDEFGIFLPVIALLCALVANYFIRKDDKLVRSMDRLR